MDHDNTGRKGNWGEKIRDLWKTLRGVSKGSRGGKKRNAASKKADSESAHKKEKTANTVALIKRGQ